jgi:acyl-CoA thioesterase-1
VKHVLKHMTQAAGQRLSFHQPPGTCMQLRTPFRTLALCWLACCVLAACSDPAPRLARLPDGALLLAFGDSLTEGAGATPAQDYPAQLARLSGHPVINAGRSGELSAEGLARLPGLLEQHRPALLILCHGGNDLLRKLDEQALRSHLQGMIDAATTRNIPVLLLGVPEPGLFMRRATSLYEELARANQLPYDGAVLAEVESSRSLKFDLIHPNNAGYGAIARAVFRLLQRSGAL